ncbi:hypothetical protein [Pedobacter agri]|uniref:hypothetical protein n=1 Tax=Pedobacter agri TaxID=454586 RepID=UPI00292D592A|nr:hypothetical protein [Pedobacter agri]
MTEKIQAMVRVSMDQLKNILQSYFRVFRVSVAKEKAAEKSAASMLQDCHSR